MAKYELWMSEMLTGGRNTRDARGQLDPTQSDDDLNVECNKFGSMTRRSGFRRVIDDVFDNGVRGIARYKHSTEGRYLLYQGDDLLVQRMGDDFPYTDRQEIITGLEVGVERYFVQNNDWLYMSGYPASLVSSFGLADIMQSSINKGKRYNRKWLRTDGTEIDGIVREIGLQAFNSDDVSPAPSASGGSMVFAGSGTEYWYRIAYQYFDLGESISEMTGTSNGGLEISGSVTSSGSVTLTFSDSNTDAENEIRIYRTLQAAAGGRADGPYYFIGTIDRSLASAYTDTKADAELVDLMPEQPLWNDLMFPRFKLMTLHQNRTWFGNVVDVADEETLDNVLAAEIHPNRLYWSDLYQPDRIMGFVDMPTTAPIMQLASFYDQLIVWQNNATRVITGSGRNSFSIRTVDAGRGCVAPRSVAILENAAIFEAGDGVCAYNGAGVVRISDEIRNDFVDFSDSEKQMACAGSHMGTYRLFFTKDAGEVDIPFGDT